MVAREKTALKSGAIQPTHTLLESFGEIMNIVMG